MRRAIQDDEAGDDSLAKEYLVSEPQLERKQRAPSASSTAAVSPNTQRQGEHVASKEGAQRLVHARSDGIAPLRSLDARRPGACEPRRGRILCTLRRQSHVVRSSWSGCILKKASGQDARGEGVVTPNRTRPASTATMSALAESASVEAADAPVDAQEQPPRWQSAYTSFSTSPHLPDAIASRLPSVNTLSAAQSRISDLATSGTKQAGQMSRTASQRVAELRQSAGGKMGNWAECAWSVTNQTQVPLNVSLNQVRCIPCHRRELC